ncbi:MAG: hypothetical protein RLZZ524_3127 [Pseudomonadota bacterium]|jgi:hypothetical protein
MSAMDTLGIYRDALGALAGVASCKIGLEANIGPADYPLIRLVPSRLTPGKPYSGRTIETLIYFGAQTTLSEGLETVYSDLFDIEALMLAEIKAMGGRYVETLTDEDRLDAYKLMTIRAELGDPQGWSKCLIACSATTETLGASPVVLAPFTSTPLNSDTDDWGPSLVNGSITRLLNGAALTLTKITVSGTVAGANASEVSIGVYKDGALVGHRVTVVTTGAANAIAFTISVVASATRSVIFDVRATGTAGAFTFSDVTVSAEKTTDRAS